MIQLNNLQKVINQSTALDIADFQVKSGEITALVGPVGSGKESLFQLLIGQSRPTVGEIQLAGLNPHTEKGPFSRQVGVLFAEDTLYKRQSVKGNLEFLCRLRGLPKSRAAKVMAQVGLADHANKRVAKLPSGLVRRLAFGCAILHEPAVLLLAEPFGRCDEATISLLTGLIKKLAEGETAVLILADSNTHLTALGDTIYTLEQGRIVNAVRPQEEQQASLPFKIPARLEGSVALVNPVDILYAMTQDGRTYLQTRDNQLPTQFTMTELEERLARSGFFRAHRGYLVNLQHVKEVIPYTRSSFSLKLDDADETKIPLSKEAARELRQLLGY